MGTRVFKNLLSTRKGKFHDLDDTEHGSTLQRKHKEAMQKNERTRINKYSEGFCYQCGSKDYVCPTIGDVCMSCIGRRGTFKDSSLLAVVHMEINLTCLFCGRFRHNRQFNSRYAGAHINFRCCQKCLRREAKVEKDIRGLGAWAHPVYRRAKRTHGKDWKILEGDRTTRR